MIPFPEIEKIAEPPLPPEQMASSWWWWAGAALLGLIVLGVLVWIAAGLFRRAALPTAPARPEKLALRELKHLRRKAAEMPAEAFAAALSGIVRSFLARRTGLAARFATTEEITGRTRRAGQAPPPPPLAALFAPVLEGCDALRFGGTGAAGAQATESLLHAAEEAVQAAGRVVKAEPSQVTVTHPSPQTDAPAA